MLAGEEAAMPRVLRPRAHIWRRRVAVAAGAAVALAGCASPMPTAGTSGSPGPSTPQAKPMAAHGVEAKVGEIPWSQVGPGWLLAMWTPVLGKSGGGEEPKPGEATYQNSAQTLYLVN